MEGGNIGIDRDHSFKLKITSCAELGWGPQPLRKPGGSSGLDDPAPGALPVRAGSAWSNTTLKYGYSGGGLGSFTQIRSSVDQRNPRQSYLTLVLRKRVSFVSYKRIRYFFPIPSLLSFCLLVFAQWAETRAGDFRAELTDHRGGTKFTTR